eukprot:TRINITY_DN11963_c0_g1_i1.p1 TRINITY_DN11963_c0_g1~~TRINITY_DN11963_c0_g1_i1.p1  ORF type:complete len:337 (+),score=51.03 TRINITY_DN11963_c0_g1_i1:99-1013(+)
MTDFTESLKKHMDARNVPFDILPVKWGTFPDGTENSTFVDIEKTENRHVLFVASFSSSEEKLRQLSAIYVLCRRHIKTLTVFLPFSPTATMERLDYGNEGTIATADVDAHFFSTMPRVAGGPIKLIIVDLHTLQNRFYFHDSALAKLITAIPLIKTELDKLKKEGHDINICYPDEGAAKRFSKFFPEYKDAIICGKVRTPDNKRIVTISEGEPKGQHVVIIDDLVQSGGTLVACRDALYKREASKVSAYVTHAVFPNESWKQFHEKEIFENFWVTNSRPRTANSLIGKKPFTVLDISELVSNSL